MLDSMHMRHNLLFMIITKKNNQQNIQIILQCKFILKNKHIVLFE